MFIGLIKAGLPDETVRGSTDMVTDLWRQKQNHNRQTSGYPVHPVAVQEEPLVITIDNVDDFVKTNSRPDVFDVKVKAVLKTRDNSSGQREEQGYVGYVDVV